jgi:hypothetical protein
MPSFEADAAMPSPTEITVAQLSRLVGLPGAPALADVRTEEEFKSDPTQTTAVTHIAIQERLQGNAVDWMEKVSDEQYRK